MELLILGGGVQRYSDGVADVHLWRAKPRGAPAAACRGTREAEALPMRYHLRRAKPRGAPAGWPEEASYDPEDATGNSLLIPLSRFLLLWRTPPFSSIGRGIFCLFWRSMGVGKIKHALLADPVIFGACARWIRPAGRGRRNRICTCESRLLSASLCPLSNRSGYFLF
jgi:hypothetical protein